MDSDTDFPLANGARLSDLVGLLRRAAGQPDRQTALSREMRRLLSDCVRLNQLIEADRPPLDENGEALIHETDGLTIYICHFSPHLTIPPHEHQMQALVGLYEGREAHQLWQETDGALAHRQEQIIETGDLLQLPANAIHSVRCLDQRVCKGLHLYLGALSRADRRFFSAGQPRPIAEMRFLPNADS
jgi:predicted metal-dependent enzyme (double-stranded beta helix superfamily)